MSAPKFTNADLTRYKQEINPAPIIGRRIKLQRENSEYVGCCAFHPDKTPSFKLYKDDAGVWLGKCFGCGISLNVFMFVQKFDNISFSAAVAKVLAEAGVEGWVDGTAQADPAMPEGEHREVVTFPIEKYTQTEKSLHGSPAGQNWLAKRGITMETARRFHLGFVQDATAVSGTSHPWAKLGWVTFPTLSADGHTVIAVKYRSLVAKKDVIDDKAVSGILRAKDTATMLYNGQTLKAGEDVWIVEGEPDTLVLAQAGVTCVGLPMAGYKLLEEEREAIASTKRRFLAGDTDSAGVGAMTVLQKRIPENTFRIKWPNGRKDANDVLTNECGNDAGKFKNLVNELLGRATQTKPVAILRNADDIEPIQVTWLWHERIPYGMITLFAGNPGNGKSMASVACAAICSTGGKFPETPFSVAAQDVLLLIGEDDIARTVVPRLKAAQANMKRIHILDAVRPIQGEDRAVSLDTDRQAVEDALEAHPNIRLLIIDPISNYLGKVSMVAEQEVRSVLTPLVQMAERRGVAVILVMHLNKKSDLDAIMRVGGAMAFVGVSRCSWLFAKNEQEEKPEGEDVTVATDQHGEEFSMLRMKNNLAPSRNTGLSYSIAVRDVRMNAVDVPTPYVKWGHVFDGTADSVLASNKNKSKQATQNVGGRPKDAMLAAIQWLEDALQDNQPHPSKVLIKDAYDAEGISSATLHRAYTTLGGVKSSKVDGRYCWQLAPMCEPKADKEVPQQSELIQVEGMA
jgi:putative DNA primase/helicase